MRKAKAFCSGAKSKLLGKGYAALGRYQCNSATRARRELAGQQLESGTPFAEPQVLPHYSDVASHPRMAERDISRLPSP